MAEGGNAEKFPDEWDIQFLGNIIASQLASGTPPDFLIKRYVFSILFYFNGSILLLKFQISFIYKILLIFFQDFSFLPVQTSSSRDRTWVYLGILQHLWLPPTDGFYPGAFDPHCSFIRRRELTQFFV